MPAYEPQLPGVPCWVDLATTDVARARTFYGTMFGWESTEPDDAFGGYVNFSRNGALVAGAIAKFDQAQPDSWTTYLLSSDAKQTVDRASAQGAMTILEAEDVGTLGTMAVLIDPTGATVGVWQPGEHRGFGLLGEHGAPGWFELHSTDYERALGFYQSVFDWTTQTLPDASGMRYSMLQPADLPYAGIADAGQMGTPASVWKVYWGVDDTDAAVRQARDLGAQVTMEPVDTPYGRHAEIIDPMGASFKLVGPNESMPSIG